MPCQRACLRAGLRPPALLAAPQAANPPRSRLTPASGRKRSRNDVIYESENFKMVFRIMGVAISERRHAAN